MWLNRDAQHVPISKEGHLSAMIDGTPSRSTCRHLHQLEVHKLLQYGGQVVYPEGLNGGLEPVQTSLSGMLLWGQDVLDDSTHDPSFLLVDLSWVTPEDHMLKAPAPWQSPDTIFPFPSCHGTSTWNRKPHQYDCWGPRSLIMCYTGHL